MGHADGQWHRVIVGGWQRYMSVSSVSDRGERVAHGRSAMVQPVTIRTLYPLEREAPPRDERARALARGLAPSTHARPTLVTLTTLGGSSAG
jgi:hypothetical protein